MQGVARIRTVIVGAIAVAAVVVATPASGSTLSCDGTARAGAGGAPELLTNCGRIDPSLGANAAAARAVDRLAPSLGVRPSSLGVAERRPHPRRPHRAVAAERPRDPRPLRRGRPRVQRRRGNALGAQQRDLRAPAIASRADRPRAGTWHRQRVDRRRHRASRRAHHRAGHLPQRRRERARVARRPTHGGAPGGLEPDRGRPERSDRGLLERDRRRQLGLDLRPEPGADGRHLHGLQRRQRRELDRADERPA